MRLISQKIPYHSNKPGPITLKEEEDKYKSWFILKLLLLLSIFSSNTNICKLCSNSRWFSHCQSLGSCDWGRRTCCCSWQVHRYHLNQIHRVQFFVPSNPPAPLLSNGDKNVYNCVLVRSNLDPWQFLFSSFLLTLSEKLPKLMSRVQGFFSNWSIKSRKIALNLVTQNLHYILGNRPT